MYPAQTSFIPVHIALARFLENQGWRAIYPYWYLGTTPFRYLTGPILPGLLVFLHKFLPGFNLFEIFFGVVGVFWVFGVLGVYWLVFSLANSSTSEHRSPPSEECIRPPRRRFALMAAIFYALGPIIPFLFRFSSGLDLITFSFLPYVLLFYTKFLERQTRKLTVLCVLSITFVMLLNSAILPSLILGMMAIFLTITGWKKAEEKLKKSFLIFAFSFLISSLWYTPGYWWQIIFAPSFAGKPFYKVVSEVAQLLPISLAIGLAILSSKIIKSKDRVLKFCFYWLFIFSFLSLIRFLSDPDFWLDWTSYGTELQLGFAILGGLLLERLLRWQEYQISNIKYQKYKLNISKACFSLTLKIKHFLILLSVLTPYFLLFAFITNKYVIDTLQKDISQSVEYRIGKFLSETVGPGEKVFLSGSSVFWLNAFFDIIQVRGGVDQVAVHPTWDKAAWEIREGKDVQKSIKWLDELGVGYLVVHTAESKEFYHDFVYPEKFENSPRMEKIYDYQGDKIYQRR